MSNTADLAEALDSLAAGDHVHLHHFLDSPPPAGARAWLPIVEKLVPSLVERGGNWTVTLPVGTAMSIAPELPTTADVFDQVSAIDVTEPPAVYRLGERLEANTWEGESHERTRVTAPGVIEVVGFDRSDDTPPSEPGFVVRVAFEVRTGS